jgi:hypothetical protein
MRGFQLGDQCRVVFFKGSNERVVDINGENPAHEALPPSDTTPLHGTPSRIPRDSSIKLALWPSGGTHSGGINMAYPQPAQGSARICGPGDAPRRRPLPLALALAALFGSGLALAQNITDSVIASGGGTVNSDRFRLTSSIGEPAAGVAEADGLRVVAGFLAKFTEVGGGQQPDEIFRNGFESLPAPPAKWESPAQGGNAS